MKKKTYKILFAVLAVICGVSLVLTCAEYQDGSIGLWNFFWLAVFATSARFLDKLVTKYEMKWK